MRRRFTSPQRTILRPGELPAEALRTGRRRFLRGMAAGAAMFATPGLFAEELTLTSPVAEGPFYPDKLPLDTDNDLLIINDAITPAVGAVTHLTGRVLSRSGAPIRNAFVEIWQVDNAGSYIHSQGGDPKTRDKNFQGYGRFLTDSKGQYYFRTIRPVSYTLFGFFRAPHIHFAISKNGRRIFTTQMLVKGHPDTPKDGLFRNLRDEAARNSVLVAFEPIKDSKIGALAAHFDIVLGRTAEELEDGTLRGGIAPPQSRVRGRRSAGGRGR